MRKGLAFILAAALVTQAASFTFAAETEPEVPQDIVILVTSDIHCGVAKNFSLVGLEQIRDTMEANGDYTILVDDGDAVQGELIGSLTQGEAIISLMNDIGYDVVIPGNHEFDYGMDQFMKLTEEADFPYISCNFRKDGELVFDPYYIKEVNGKKIGFVGVTTPETINSSTPVYFQDEDGNFIYDFCADKSGEMLYDAVQNAVDAVRAEGVDYVFLMAHLGNSDTAAPWTYADVVSNISGVDGVLDGHSHDTDQVTMLDKDGNEVFRMGVGTKMAGIGCVRISGEDGSISHELLGWNNAPAMPDLLGLENNMTAPMAELDTEFKEVLQTVVGKTEVDLTIVDPEAVDGTGAPIRIIRRAETNLGDLCTDAYRTGAGADVAMLNGGTIRASIAAGDITNNDLLTVLPYVNKLTVLEATGQQILDALEWGAHSTPDEFGGFLQVSGLTYEIHTYIPNSCEEDEHGMFVGVNGEYRVKNVMIGGEPIDLEKTYTLVSTDYTLENEGDGFTMFKDCNIIQSGVLLDTQVLIDYVTNTLGGTVSEGYENPYGQGRIVAVDEAPAAETEAEAATETES